MSTGKLVDKTALITGGTSGMGLATARLFLAEGAKVIVTGLPDKHFDETCAEFGDLIVVLPVNAASVAELPGLVEKVKEVFDTLDILFLNAGVLRATTAETFTEADVDLLFNLHVKGPLFYIREFVPMMREGSSIICTTSNSCRTRIDGTMVYAATKAALKQLMRSFAGELSPKGIRVNAISPGPIATNVAEGTNATPEQMKKILDFTLAKTPMGRFGEGHEIATVALFLSTVESSFITGQEIGVDGGWSPGVSL